MLYNFDRRKSTNCRLFVVLEEVNNKISGCEKMQKIQVLPCKTKPGFPIRRLGAGRGRGCEVRMDAEHTHASQEAPARGTEETKPRVSTTSQCEAPLSCHIDSNKHVHKQKNKLTNHDGLNCTPVPPLSPTDRPGTFNKKHHRVYGM